MNTHNDDQSLCSYLDLFRSLPRGGLSGRPGPALAITAVDDLFVGPTLRVVEAPERPSITLISARGATGKSVLARRLSATAHAPLWDLALDRGVSADALAGRLIDYLGPNGPAQFASSTEAFLVIDALDEARMRVSALSWSEFLDSLVAVADKGHRFVLLGRERILEDVWVHFDDAGRSCAWYEISHFNSQQRAEYVDRRYEAAGQQTTPAYKQARDAVLRALAGTVDSSLAESFVGYAPVLDAVVTLLVRDNPMRVLNAFEQDIAAEDRVDVLRTVLERLAGPRSSVHLL